eukprot:9476407-Pyramimonas_sp.AAC.1
MVPGLVLRQRIEVTLIIMVCAAQVVTTVCAVLLAPIFLQGYARATSSNQLTLASNTPLQHPPSPPALDTQSLALTDDSAGAASRRLEVESPAPRPAGATTLSIEEQTPAAAASAGEATR